MEGINVGKAIVVLNKRTNKTKHYEKITDAVKDLGFLDNQFYSALKGKTNKLTEAGYLVYEYADYHDLNKVREHNTDVKFKKYDRNTPVYMIDPYTNEILDRFESVKQASEDMGVNYLVSIRKCCAGIYKTAHGYKWEYVS